MNRLPALLFLCAVAMTSAQEDNPLLKAVAQLGKTGFKSGSLPASSAGTYKPTGSRPAIQRTVALFATDEEEKKAFRQIIEVFVKNYEDGVKGSPLENEAIGTIATCMVGMKALSEGKDMSEGAIESAYKSLLVTLNTDEIKKATNQQKQDASDTFLAQYGLFASLYQAVESKEQKAKLSEATGKLLMALTGTEPGQITMTDKEFAIMPAKNDDVVGNAPGFTYASEGWTPNQGWLIKSKAEASGGGGTRTTSAMIRFLPAVPVGKGVGELLGDLWKTNVPSELGDRISGMVFRRYVGDGIPAFFVVGSGMEKGRDCDSLFTLIIVDCKTHWQPVVLAQTYEETSTFRTGIEMSARFSFNESAPLAEEMLKTFRCPSGKGRPLFDSSSLVGDFGYGNYASMDYVNVYSGASSTSYVSYGGILNLKSDGNFVFSYSSASSQYSSATQFGGQKGAGKWTVEGDLLKLRFTSFEQIVNGVKDGYQLKEKTYRICSSTTFPDGVKIVILKDRLDVAVNAQTVGDKSEWYSTKKKQ